MVEVQIELDLPDSVMQPEEEDKQDDRFCTINLDILESSDILGNSDILKVENDMQQM